MKKISIILPCFNEEENLSELYERLILLAKNCPEYLFEFLFIDNASTDNSALILRKIAYHDSRAKVIINTRNFGHIRSPAWAMRQATGDAVVGMTTDLQDPPELIQTFIQEWELGWKVVLGVKYKTKNNILMDLIRKIYYRILQKMSDVHLINDAHGFGLFDRSVVDLIKLINDPYPYTRGLIAELGFKTKSIKYIQDKRRAGNSKNRFYNLYDMAMLGITSHTLVPIRLVGIFGFLISITSIMMAIVFIFIKITHWDDYPIGIAPLIIINFFLFGIIIFFLSLIGEYIASMQKYLKNRPLVVEEERINFE